MKLVLAAVALVSALLAVTAQDDGKYRAPTTTTTVRPFPRYRTFRPYDPYRYNNDGRYTGGNDGRYVPRSDGRYSGGNDGRYVPGNDGRYVHVGDGDRGKYSHVEGPSGPNTSNQGPSGRGSGNSGGFGSGAPQTRPAPAPAPAAPVAPVAPPPAATVAPPPASVPQLAKQAQVRTAPPRPLDADGWKIIRLENQLRGDGYNYIFETQNGINAEESGRIEATAEGKEGLRSHGFYEYIGDDGQLYRVDYVADTNGFLPQGDHIPKVPPAIEKLLQYLASQPKK